MEYSSVPFKPFLLSKYFNPKAILVPCWRNFYSLSCASYSCEFGHSDLFKRARHPLWMLGTDANTPRPIVTIRFPYLFRIAAMRVAVDEHTSNRRYEYCSPHRNYLVLSNIQKEYQHQLRSRKIRTQ